MVPRCDAEARKLPSELSAKHDSAFWCAFSTSLCSFRV
jgi:hypothetical protein